MFRRRFTLSAVLLSAALSAPALAQSVPSPQPVITPSAAPLPQATPQPQSSPQPQAPPLQRGLPPPPQPAGMAPVPSVAPGYAAPAQAPPSGDLVGVSQPFVGITLTDAIGMALMRNPDLAIAQANRRIAAYQIVAARGAYDVRFTVEPSYSHTVQPPQNAFFAGPNFGPIVTDQSGVSAGFSGMTQSGQQYSVSAGGSRVSSNSIINSFNPTYPTSLSFNLTQPLLRGRAINEASRQLQLAAINADTTSAQALAGASQTVTSVSDT